MADSLPPKQSMMAKRTAGLLYYFAPYRTILSGEGILTQRLIRRLDVNAGFRCNNKKIAYSRNLLDFALIPLND